MGAEQKVEGMLSPYRALDLTDEKGLLCGKLLGDLGADVIKIERPGGDPARSIGPFYHDDTHPEKSLFWFAFNTNKRGITLNIETSDGRDIFKKLVKSADFVIESFPPGHMEKLRLGYADLEEVNPGIIMISITPFGQTGPYKDYAASDIVAWAMGGYMYPTGDSDRPPVRISHHSQAYLHAGAEAAVGAMMALYYRQITGEGEHVDVSVHASVANLLQQISPDWDILKVVTLRGEPSAGDGRTRRMWPCQDGHVMWLYWSGALAKRFNPGLIEWMDNEGMAGDFLRQIDWDTFDLRTTTPEVLDRISEPTARFFLSHTKAELLEGAVKRSLMLYPVASTDDILGSAQLAAREFWTNLEYPELGTTITHPGAFAKSSAAPPRVARRAPLIGEHNEEIYEKELGLSREQLLTLKQAGVI